MLRLGDQSSNKLFLNGLDYNHYWSLSDTGPVGQPDTVDVGIAS